MKVVTWACPWLSMKVVVDFFSGPRKTNQNVIETHLKNQKKTWCVEARQGRVAPRFFLVFQVGIRVASNVTCVVGYLAAELVIFYFLVGFLKF
jgi:hypothetical protein